VTKKAVFPGGLFSLGYLSDAALLRQRGAGVVLDALDHRAESVRSLRRQMLAKTQALEQRDRIGGEDLFACRPE
jgi:hypothetical protein